MRRLGLILLLSFLAPLAARAQAPFLVKDINLTRNADARSSVPQYFFRYGSGVFFTASMSPFSPDNELWRTDGTEPGTTQVSNIASGSVTAPPRFAIVNGTLLFNARDLRGEELWMSDGTTAGTRLMADINSGSPSSRPGDRIVHRGKMIFTAEDGVNGRELWITDGTPAGTRFLKDLEPGRSGSEPSSFVLFQDQVYFLAASALWKTDGTDAGTVKVKAPVDAFALAVAGNHIFFNGYTEQTGAEPWVSDGTEAGTFMLKDIHAGREQSVYYEMAPFGDRVLFLARDEEHGTEPWISDGTVAGTRLVRDIIPGPDDYGYPPQFAVIGGTALFSYRTPAAGIELWKTDGTEAGTVLVSDIVPGTVGSNPAQLIVVGSRIYFVASNETMTGLLWTSDGTAGGTHLVPTTEPRPRIASINGPMLTHIDGALYFAGANALNGAEPWKSDGTDAGTFMIANLVHDPAPSSRPESLIAAGDLVFFHAWDGLDNSGDRSLWRSDGTPEGTRKLLDAPGSEYQSAGRSLFFRRDNELWISDGTPQGTKRATEFTSRFPRPPSIEFVLGNTILAASEEKLWATTLAAGAPAVRLDAPSGFAFSDFAGRAVYLSEGLWTSDGTSAGTYPIVPRLAERPYGYAMTAVAAGRIYFTTHDKGQKLWVSDGTYEGTRILKAGTSDELVVAGRHLFFTAGSNRELWVTDGTDAGTRALPAVPREKLAAIGERVVFNASDSTAGAELWVSDGTVEGTRLLRDIHPGADGSEPLDLTAAGGLVYLRAYDSVHGSELWVTDGTAEGTRLAADLEPGAASSVPSRFAVTSGSLFFTANTSATGIELWALPYPATPRLSIDDIRLVEGNSGAKSARFTARLSSAASQTITVEYATSDGTASAGSDYDAATGTLTFVAGETTKSIDVQVRGESALEGNEAFSLTLRNPAGATLEKPFGFAVIEDDDRNADLALGLDFSFFDSASVFVTAANHGPSMATNVRARVTATPADVAASTCASCPGFPSVIEPGASLRAYEYRWFGFQQYLTATVTARESDSNPANNSVGWTTHNDVAMDALFLTPGGAANVWFDAFENPASVSVESSDPTVLTVPASVATTPDGKPVSFVARGVGVGTATIRVFTPQRTIGILAVDVVAPGTALRWPGAINVFADSYQLEFDDSVRLRIYTPATAPFNGQPATGPVSVSANGREVGRVILTADKRLQSVTFYVPDIGTNTITVAYAGDANFLPTAKTFDVQASRGSVTITGIGDRNGTAATIHVRVAGSPMASPTGTITISEPGIIAPVEVALVPGPYGDAKATVTLPNVSAGEHTLVVQYSGDTRYRPSTQNIRIHNERRRSVRH